MLTKSSTRLALALAIASFLLVACGGEGSSTAVEATNSNQGEFVFGEPADPANADRDFEIATTDDLVSIPADLTVKAGETITFRIVNEGTIAHDFTLGDETTQDRHEQEMAEVGMEHDQPNAVTVAAGETKELTWTFVQPGTVLVGCHQPGHYDAGMKGLITVEE